MPPTDTRKDLPLSEGEYVYLRELASGITRINNGPTNINLSAQEEPVVWDPRTESYVTSTLEQAKQKVVSAKEGQYVELRNPTKSDKDGQLTVPESGKAKVRPDLEFGRKVNLTGPQLFALWPQQSAKIFDGHRLRSNQYLVIQVYNIEEAKKNWSKAIGHNSHEAPTTLSVGQRFNIKGTEISYYIPPTGIEVVADQNGSYIRDALSLEQMEYSILVDENGKKRYPRGPVVVFPAPTEVFLSDPKDASKLKWRAYELNKNQGIHVSVIADYQEETGEFTEEPGIATHDGKNTLVGRKIPKTVLRKAGEELFIKGIGKDTIYFPREEHMLIRYDGQDKHYGVSIPSGEARYVMHRYTGEIKTVKGPAVYLPDPREEVFVRRALNQDQCSLWYPGNQAVLEYNMKLGEFQLRSPTTRSGVVSEGDYSRQSGTLSSTAADNLSRETARMESFSNAGSVMYASAEPMMRSASASTAKAGMSVSDQNRKSAGMAGDTSERTEKSSFQKPRTLVLNTKLDGVPMVKPWVGYACMVVAKDGTKRVEQGPNTILLKYDEELEVLTLSTGKPKSQDRLFRTVYLQVRDNKVSDIIEVTTKDHVRVRLMYSLNVVFEGEPTKWFGVMNYVKMICDHVRSILKGAVKKQTIEEFFLNASDIIRDTILGTKTTEGKGRTGMAFESNGSRVTDVDVLDVAIQDGTISESLEEAARSTVQQNIQLNREKRKLEVTKATEELNRQSLEEVAATRLKHNELEVKKITSDASVKIEEFKLEGTKQIEFKKLDALKSEVADSQAKATIARQEWVRASDLKHQTDAQGLKLATLVAETAATEKKMMAASQGFGEIVAALHNQETLTRVAEAVSVQRMIGGESVTDALTKVLGDTPIAGMLAAAVQKANASILTTSTNGASKAAARG